MVYTSQNDPLVDQDQLLVSLPKYTVTQIDQWVGGDFHDREELVQSAIHHYLRYLQRVQNAAEATDIG